MHISDEDFQELIDKAFESLPVTHRDRVQNVAILFADEPTPEQRVELELRHDQTLLGLYEGVPLASRQGQTNTFMPDRITLFKLPLLQRASTKPQLYEEIRHTLWHEVAHYFGLDHDEIYKREQ
jgi:predicted Zn-dependent protease with MMP-like domain